jgi:hypothetical protein
MADIDDFSALVLALFDVTIQIGRKSWTTAVLVLILVYVDPIYCETVACWLAGQLPLLE